jgi:hypothetical protein
MLVFNVERMQNIRTSKTTVHTGTKKMANTHIMLHNS